MSGPTVVDVSSGRAAAHVGTDDSRRLERARGRACRDRRSLTSRAGARPRISGLTILDVSSGCAAARGGINGCRSREGARGAIDGHCHLERVCGRARRDRRSSLSREGARPREAGSSIVVVISRGRAATRGKIDGRRCLERARGRARRDQRLSTSRDGARPREVKSSSGVQSSRKKNNCVDPNEYP
jgi:hypothetical protein